MMVSARIAAVDVLELPLSHVSASVLGLYDQLHEQPTMKQVMISSKQ
jgi:hypothetical protein